MSFSLSKEQQDAYDLYLSGQNILVSGPGGSGKSILIKKINEHARQTNKRIQICALTGVATSNLNISKAKTLNSWSGIGLAKEDHNEIIEKVATNRYKKKYWSTTDILVVDEVSMLSKSVFELLDKIGRRIKKDGSTLPFGGIQLIFVGDFYQLPPISEDFCFESSEWSKSFSCQNTIILKKVFRQTNDIYINILNEIREGNISAKSIEILEQRVSKQIPENITCSKILPTRKAVETINNTEIQKLTSKEEIFTVKHVSPDLLQLTVSEKSSCKKITDKQREIEYAELTRNLICDKTIVLKKGAHVMCIVNIVQDNNLLICNGSQGIIIDFQDGLPIVKFNNGIVRKMSYHNWKSEKIPDVAIMQIPLILSWAITIHKSQGITLDNAEIDAGNNIFEEGQTYVALSRLRTLEGLYLTHFNPRKIKNNKKVEEFYKSIERMQQ